MAGKVVDPVCGMEIDPATAKYKSEHGGRVFYFCAEGCKREFEKTPHKYMKEAHSH